MHSRKRSLGAALVRASWGADVNFADAKILETGTAAHSLQRMFVDIGPAATGYTKPGQFIQAKMNDAKPGFFAIASAPGANNGNVVELLIKNQGAAAELLCNAKEGTTIQVSEVMGKGFAVERVPAPQFHSVYLFATGSGISPVKALIESGALDASSRRQVRLYYGARNPSAMAYGDKLAQWEADYGIRVVPVYSEQGKGYIQDVFAGDGVPEGAGHMAAVLCGQKGMAEAVTEILSAAGVDKSAILLNF